MGGHPDQKPGKIHRRLHGTGTIRIFEGMSIKEQGYNPALAVLRLSNKSSEARLKAAGESAIISGIKKPRYHHLSSILAPRRVLHREEKADVKSHPDS